MNIILCKALLEVLSKKCSKKFADKTQGMIEKSSMFRKIEGNKSGE